MLNRETYGVGSPFDSIQSELEQLQKLHADALNHPDVQQDVHHLLKWIESYRQGNDACAARLEEEGQALLQRVQQAVQAAGLQPKLGDSSAGELEQQFSTALENEVKSPTSQAH
jgi:hypothetical protein